MALTSIPPVWVPAFLHNATGNLAFGTAVTIDASTDKVAGIFRAREDMVVSKIAVRFGTVTSSNELVYRVETVDTATDATPTGTLWNTNTTTGNVTPSANVIVEGTLTANATISAGQMYAVVIQPADADAVNLQIARWDLTSAMVHMGGQVPYGSNNTTGSYANAALLPVVGLYNNTTSKWVHNPVCPLITTATATSAINTGTGATTGTKRGLSFKMAGPMRLRGMLVKMSSAAGADFDVEIYSTGGSLLATLLNDYDSSQQRAATGALSWYLPFETTYSVEAATEYYLVIAPTTANSVTLHEFSVADAAYLDTFYGQDLHGVAFISSTWTETTTVRPWFFLEFDQIDDGAGSGGGPVISSGMRGGFVN